MTTIKTILEEMRNVVSKGEIKSPSWWCDRGLELLALWQELKDEMTKSEIEYKREVNEIVEKFDYGNSKAENIVKGYLPKIEGEMTTYQKYKYLDGRDKIIKEFVMMAKKRATIEDNFNN